MTKQTVSVISSRDIVGVVAKLNNRLNRSADRSALREASTDKTPKPAPIGKPSACPNWTNGVGSYTFRVRIPNGLESCFVGVVTALAESKDMAISSVQRDLWRKARISIEFVLLRFRPLPDSDFQAICGITDASIVCDAAA